MPLDYSGPVIPGTPLLGARYQQEVAMDRAEIPSLCVTLQAPAGKFEKCLKTEEAPALESAKAHKLDAPTVGLILDGNLKLTKYGQAVR